MTAELLLLMVAADPTVRNGKEMFASWGKVTDMHMKSKKSRWSGDIVCICARVCPEMGLEAVRTMGRTDASLFMECADSHLASISAWTEGAADLGDAEEFDEGDEALSDDEGEDEDDGDS